VSETDHRIQPPPLPPGEVRPIGGRGELFVRRCGEGAGTPVVLIHGWQATADLNFHPLFAPLGMQRSVIAADLRGHGRSLLPEQGFTLEDAADDHAALLDELGIDCAIVVGYSLGTAVAQVLVDRHPSRVEAIVLAGGEVAPRRRPHVRVMTGVGGWQGTFQRMTSGRWGAHRMVDKAVRENPDAEVLRGWLVTEIERGHVASLRAAGRAHARFDGHSIAERHDVPTAVVLTTRDRLVRPGRQAELAHAWNAEVIELDADHDAPIAQPEAFVRAVIDAIGLVDTHSSIDRRIAS